MTVKIPSPLQNTHSASTQKIDPKLEQKAEKAAQEFEALFLDIMLQSMRKTAAPEEQSNAQSIYSSMLDSEYSKSMSSSHTFGIKELILDWMRANQAGLGKSNSAQEGGQPNPLSQLKDGPGLSTRLATEVYQLQSKLVGNE